MKAAVNQFSGLAIAIFFVFHLLMATPLKAQWSSDIMVNNPVVVDEANQLGPEIVSDMRGGALIAYRVTDNPPHDYNIYVQRIDSQGNTPWGTTPVAVVTHPAYQSPPSVCSDAKGGIILAWFDHRTTDNRVLVQRIDSAGAAKWQTDGVEVGTTPDAFSQGDQQLIADGNGGAFIVFVDWKGSLSDSKYTIRAQWINAHGQIQWVPDGIALHKTTTGSSGSPQIVSDGNGGAIVVWQHWDGVYPDGNRNIYAQKFNASGSLAWGEHGLTICNQESEQRFPKLAGDGQGGAIILWEDYRDGDKTPFYGQKINSQGDAMWTPNGIPMTVIPRSAQTSYQILSNGNGGAYITYLASFYSTLVQMVDHMGQPQWGDMGMSPCDLCSSPYPRMIPDGEGGIIVVWNTDMQHVQAQRIDVTGKLIWAPKGAWISYVLGKKSEPIVANDGQGGAVVAWSDFRNNISASDIYAQHITARGDIGNYTYTINRATPSLSLEQNHPNPLNDHTTIGYKIITPSHVTLKVYNCQGQEVKVLVDEVKTPGQYTVTIYSPSLSPGLYIYCLNNGQETISRTMVVSKD